MHSDALGHVNICTVSLMHLVMQEDQSVKISVR